MNIIQLYIKRQPYPEYARLHEIGLSEPLILLAEQVQDLEYYIWTACLLQREVWHQQPLHCNTRALGYLVETYQER